ncbi:MAG TPA: GNAT family N-acetyltransferase [Candidatus Polarisedimenticolia bacterium]|nr:GNAT family N-acetyltransferase [Candidatus Polarisedimenticolia bacterium]
MLSREDDTAVVEDADPRWAAPRPSLHGGPTGIRVETLDRATFLGLEKEWNALVERTCDEPFYRHEFIRSWVDSFVPGAAMKILTGHDHAGRLVAALPLVADRGFFYGVPVRRLVAPASLHSARFDMIAADRRAAALAFVRALAGDGSWDVLRLNEVRAGGTAWDLYHAAAGAGFPSGTWDSHRSPFLPLPATWAALEARLSRKFRRNLRRGRAWLEARGRITIERLSGAEAVRAGLEECFALERGGWKGRSGTAAAQSRGVLGFYTGLAHAAARGGYFSLTFLVVDGKRIAAQYGLTRGGTYSLMMTCYDEAFAECSPGQLLMEDVLKRAIADGLRGFEFLGVDGAWKLAWKPDLLPHHWLFIFRDSLLGRTLRNAKFTWLPAAKTLVPAAKQSLRRLQARPKTDGETDTEADNHLPTTWA